MPFIMQVNSQKNWKHRNNINLLNTNNNIKWPAVCTPSQHAVAVIIAELSIPQCRMYRVDIKKGNFRII